MNGTDATKEIRSTNVGKRVPIVGLTAEAFSNRHAEFREAGMVDVLTKPFTEQQLVNTIAANSPIDPRKVARHTERPPVSATKLDTHGEKAIGEDLGVLVAPVASTSIDY